jgi:hypothetical protein
MASGLSSQQQSPGAPPLSLPGSQDNNGPVIPDHMKKEMEKKANERRQADIRRDTERLVKLSTELKEYVDKSNENILSLDVIKKADEIEKLAHSVKTKMRGEN